MIENREVFERAGQAVMAKIMQNDKAAEALKTTGPGRVAIPTVNAPDLQKEAPSRRRKGDANVPASLDVDGADESQFRAISHAPE